jgi:hypothetical protein
MKCSSNSIYFKSLLYELNGNFVVQKLIELSGERRKRMKTNLQNLNLKCNKENENNNNERLEFTCANSNSLIKELDNEIFSIENDNENSSNCFENTGIGDEKNMNKSLSFCFLSTNLLNLEINYRLLQQHILSLFQGSLVEMSTKKYSNNIVEKCIECFLGEEKIKVIEELIKGFDYAKFYFFFLFSSFI